MIKVPDFAPGCFGSALAFQADDVICRNCVFSSQCEPVHSVAKTELRKRFGVTVRETKKTMADKFAGSTETVLPSKTQMILDRIDNSNFDIVGKLNRGENPFGSSMRFLTVACHLLLRRPFITQEHITAGCVYSLKCQRSTAEAYSRIAIQILSHVGAIESNDGMMTIKRI